MEEDPSGRTRKQISAPEARHLSAVSKKKEE